MPLGTASMMITTDFIVDAARIRSPSRVPVQLCRWVEDPSGREAETGVATGGQTTERASTPEIQNEHRKRQGPRRTSAEAECGGAAHTWWRLAWGATGRWVVPTLVSAPPVRGSGRCHPRSRTVQAGDTVAHGGAMLAEGHRGPLFFADVDFVTPDVDHGTWNLLSDLPRNLKEPRSSSRARRRWRGPLV